MKVNNDFNKIQNNMIRIINTMKRMGIILMMIDINNQKIYEVNYLNGLKIKKLKNISKNHFINF